MFVPQKKAFAIKFGDSNMVILSFTLTATYATEACGIITKELFAPCFSYLSPLPYFEQCRRDTCKCGQICMCSALSHYAHLCHRYGVVIDFRSYVPECGKLLFSM